MSSNGRIVCFYKIVQYIKSWPHSSCYLNLTSSASSYLPSQHKWCEYECVHIQIVSMFAACLKSLEHVNMHLCDFSNLEDSDCCLFMIMQYSYPSQEAGQILSAPLMKMLAPPRPWNCLKHAIWQNQIYIMGFIPWGWDYGEERTRMSSIHLYNDQ